MSVQAEQIIERWLDIRLGETTRGQIGTRRSSRLYCDTVRAAPGGPDGVSLPALFSYGPHFPLAVWVKPALRRRGFRARPLVVLNGDHWPGGWGTTTRHQGYVRAAVEKRNVDTILIPFTALDAAGIDVATIEPREIRPDKSWDESHESPRLDDVPRYKRTRHEKVTRHASSWDSVPAPARTYAHVDAQGTVWSDPIPSPSDGTWYRYADEGKRRRRYDYSAGHADAGLWRVPVGPVQASDGTIPFEAWDNVPVRPDADGLYRWDVHRHRLGDCLFSAETVHEPTGDVLDPRVRRRRVFVSSFDMNEPAPLYFLAEVPRRAGARTVDHAIQALAPRAVHAAIAQGRDVQRQGDVFAISVPLSTSDVYARARTRARLTQWSHGSIARKGEVGYRAPMRAAEWRAFNADVRARYHVIRAEQAEKAMRTGPGTSPTGSNGGRLNDTAGGSMYINNARDLYRLAYGRNALSAYDRARSDVQWSRRWNQRFAPSGIQDLVRDALAIHGTSHTATEVVVADGGVTYCRGTLRQVPALERGRGGERDHVAIKLGTGDEWYLMIRNTVPARAQGRPVGGPLR